MEGKASKVVKAFRNSDYFWHMRRLLLPFSWIYGFIVLVRNKFFDWKVLRAQSFDVPVITVGNLSVGGTGKSPMVLHLAAELQKQYKTAILSRGYGRKTKGFILLDEHAVASEVGDEPMQYIRLLRDVKVAVCERRVDGIHALLKQFPDIELILLDDAFQHRYVRPSISLLLTEYGRPYFNDHLLPAGTLREPVSGAARADLVIVTKCRKEIPEAEQRDFISRLRPAKPERIFFSYIHYRDLVNRKTGEVLSCDDIQGKRVLLVCGIARPEPLRDFLQQKGADVQELFFPDHHAFTSGDALLMWKRFSQSDCTMMITTRKDAMRLEAAELQQHLDRMTIFILDIAPAFSGSNGDPAGLVKQLLIKQNKTR